MAEVRPIRPSAGAGRSPASGDFPDRPRPQPHAEALQPAASLRSISCSRCAGPLRVSDGDRLLTCGHCGTSFLLPEAQGFARRYFPAKVARLEAVGKASAWLAQHPDVPADIESAAFTEAQLVYLPIWEARAYLVGWEFGKKLRTRAEVVRAPNLGGDLFGEEVETMRLDLVDEGVQEAFFDERRLYQAATDLPALGMSRPHITGREFLMPYLPGEIEEGAVLLEADGECEAVHARARQAFLHPTAGAATRDSRLFLLRESMALLYYPLWSLRYRYHGRLYEMSVDGRSGVIHSARAPADNRRRLVVMVASFAAMAVALAFAAWGWEKAGALRDVYLYIGLLVLASAGGVYWRFKLLREVEYHEPFSA
jgi:hypothetical protein